MPGIIDKYKEAHRISGILHKEALKCFAADGATHTLRMFNPFRPYITHADGSRKWDVDGNEYIDYIMGHGSLVLGHNHPKIVQAIKEQAEKGLHYAENHELEVRWAHLIQEMMPVAERVEFFCSGTEANQMAIRIARAFTARERILKFKEHFHGWGEQWQSHGTPGIPVSVQNNVVEIPANDLKRVENELSKREYALLMTEGGGARMGGQIPLDKKFVSLLRDVTAKHGTLWHIDEVVTGFRDEPGGWESTLGLSPDLATIGKAAGGGMGVGAVLGRADIFELFSSRTPEEKRVSHQGTWNACPLTAAAGVAACTILKTGDPQNRINDLGNYFREEGNARLEKQGFNVRFYNPTRSIVWLYIGSIDYEPYDDNMPPTKDVDKLLNPANTPTRQRLALHLLQRGIATSGARYFVLSTAHTKEDVDQTLNAIENSLKDMIIEGTFQN